MAVAASRPYQGPSLQAVLSRSPAALSAALRLPPPAMLVVLCPLLSIACPRPAAAGSRQAAACHLVHSHNRPQHLAMLHVAPTFLAHHRELTQQPLVPHPQGCPAGSPLAPPWPPEPCLAQTSPVLQTLSLARPGAAILMLSKSRQGGSPLLPVLPVCLPDALLLFTRPVLPVRFFWPGIPEFFCAACPHDLLRLLAYTTLCDPRCMFPALPFLTALLSIHTWSDAVNADLGHQRVWRRRRRRSGAQRGAAGGAIKPAL